MMNVWNDSSLQNEESLMVQVRIESIEKYLWWQKGEESKKKKKNLKWDISLF